MLSPVQFFATPWTVAHHPLSIGCPRQEYWSGFPFPSPGDLPDPEIEPVSPALADVFFCFLPLSHLGKPQHTVKNQEIDSHKILLTQVQILFRVCQNISDYLSSLNLNQFPFKRPPVSSYCHPGQCKSKA